jgi:hypothetical protein
MDRAPATDLAAGIMDECSANGAPSGNPAVDTSARIAYLE